MDGTLKAEKAQVWADILNKAYKGQLAPIDCNPFMKEEKKDKEILITSLNIKLKPKELFPLTTEKLNQILAKLPSKDEYKAGLKPIKYQLNP